MSKGMTITEYLEPQFKEMELQAKAIGTIVLLMIIIIVFRGSS